MPDLYPDFASLARALREGADYAIRARPRDAAFAVAAPHGGGIEPGTSELAEAIAGERHSFYAFEGVRVRGNAELHITSTRFDEPRAVELVTRATTVIVVHGEASDGEGVFIGGRDHGLGGRLALALRSAGFRAGPHDDPALHGTDPANLCNRGTSGAGIQLEISRVTRASLFASLTRAGRRERRPRFDALVEAIRGVLE